MLTTIVLALAMVAGQDQDPVRTVDQVDQQRYAGEWYEIARIPNDFQDQAATRRTRSPAPRRAPVKTPQRRDG